jgi:hypothetical protein
VTDRPAAPRGERDDRAPIFGRWSAWYAIVLAELALTILALGWIAAVFR